MDTANLIDKLFMWKAPLVIGDSTLYIRVVSDATLEDARNAALIASRRLRKELRNPESDMHLIHLDSVADASDEELRVAIVGLNTRDIARLYVNTNPKPVLADLGDNPTQEEQEEHLAAKETREEEYFNNLQAHLESWRSDYGQVLANAPRHELERLYKKHKVDRVCEETFTKVFENYVLAAAVYLGSDFKKRAFTLAQFLELPTSVRDSIRDKYNSTSMTSDEVKN